MAKKPGILARINRVLPIKLGSSESVTEWTLKLKQGQAAYEELATLLLDLDKIMKNPAFEYALAQINRMDIHVLLAELTERLREDQEDGN